jgi:hypothetical protein
MHLEKRRVEAILVRVFEFRVTEDQLCEISNSRRLASSSRKQCSQTPVI